MKLGLLVAVLACIGFCQSAEPQTIFERHGVLELATTHNITLDAIYLSGLISTTLLLTGILFIGHSLNMIEKKIERLVLHER